MGTGAKVGLIAGGVLLGLAGCTAGLVALGGGEADSVEAEPSATQSTGSAPIASPEPTAPAPTVSVEPEVAAATWPTCEELVPDVVRISEENASLPVKVLQVYNATVVNDQTAKYDDGSLGVAPGETRVTVLTCSGDAAADDGSQVPISFELQVDVNEEFFVSFEPEV